MQQFCGINAIAYYASNVFIESGFSDLQAFLASFGFGATNFVFAIPALYIIDRFGRRKLVLSSYPLMSLFLLLTGIGFLLDNQESRTALIAIGIYLFTVSYSPGAGPVPFAVSDEIPCIPDISVSRCAHLFILQYSAEAYPSSIRDFGMSVSTSVLWFL